jgi:hypothetical protein
MNRPDSPDPIDLFTRQWETESSGETVGEVVDVEADSVVGHGGWILWVDSMLGDSTT